MTTNFGVAKNRIPRQKKSDVVKIRKNYFDKNKRTIGEKKYRNSPLQAISLFLSTLSFTLYGSYIGQLICTIPVPCATNKQIFTAYGSRYSLEKGAYDDA